MAHTCPECGMVCHCGGDIDDICFGEADEFCSHCAHDEDNDWEDDFDWQEETKNPNDSRNL